MKRDIIIKAGVLIVKHSKLLLIKERRGRDGKYCWNIVKGTFEPEKDRDFVETATREAKEEANASITIKNLLHVLYLKERERIFIQFNFVADLVGTRFAVSPKEKQRTYRKDEDIIDVRLFSKRDLKNMKRAEFMGARAYRAIQDWLKGERHELGLLKTVNNF